MSLDRSGYESDASSASWYLVVTKPRRERLACEQLDRQGFETYFPRAYAATVRRGRCLGIVEPLFPRYLFVRARGAEQSLQPIRYTRGVLAMVRSGERLARASDALIAQIRAREDGATGLHHVQAPAALRPGQCVSVVDGPLAGLHGILHSTRGQDRVVLLLKMLGTQASVVVPIGLLAVAN